MLRCIHLVAKKNRQSKPIGEKIAHEYTELGASSRSFIDRRRLCCRISDDYPSRSECFRIGCNFILGLVWWFLGEIILTADPEIYWFSSIETL